MAETYESKINREPVQGWTRRTVADGDYLQSKTIQPLVNRDSILAKGLDDTNTLINGMSDKVDNVETKCNAQEALVKSLSGDVEDFCASATEAFEQIKTNEQTLAGNVETIQQSFNTLSGDVWNMNFMGFKDSMTVLVKEEIEQGKHMFSFSSVGGGGGGTSYDMAWYPSVDTAGNISWEWNRTTTAPTTKNIKGPKGNPGTNGTNGTNGADACPISAKSTDIENGHNVKIFYTSAANSDTNPLADFNVLDGQDGSDIKFDNDTNGTMSGTGQSDDPYGVNTEVLATHTWVENQHYIANVSANTNAFSGNGTSQNPLALKINNPDSTKKYGYQPDTGWTIISEGGGGTDYDIIGNNGISAKKDTANTRYEVGLSAKFLQTVSADTNTLSGNGTSESPLGITKTKNDNWDSAYEVSEAYKVASGNFATSAGLNQDIQYAMTTNGWEKVVVPSTSGYLPLSGGTVSGKLTVSGSNFDNSLEIKRGGETPSTSTGQVGINGAGGLSLKITDGNNNNTQFNIAPNATMDKRFSIGSVYQPTAYLIPAVTATTTAGLTDDGILHIIVEN